MLTKLTTESSPAWSSLPHICSQYCTGVGRRIRFQCIFVTVVWDCLKNAYFQGWEGGGAVSAVGYEFRGIFVIVSQQVITVCLRPTNNLKYDFKKV